MMCACQRASIAVQMCVNMCICMPHQTSIITKYASVMFSWRNCYVSRENLAETLRWFGVAWRRIVTVLEFDLRFDIAASNRSRIGLVLFHREVCCLVLLNSMTVRLKKRLSYVIII